MISINTLGWILQVDAEATASYYETAMTDLCNCAYCRNYVAAFPDHFPRGFVELLQSMRIDPLKPFHISEVCADDDDHHMYIGHYDFVGAIIKEPQEQHKRGERFSFDVIGRTPNPNIMFSVTIPWVLDEEAESVPC